METRALRSRRMDPPAAVSEADRTTRRTRHSRTTSEEVALPRSGQSRQQQTPTAKAQSNRGLGLLGIARRGAPARPREASIASIQTVLYRPDDETIFDESGAMREPSIGDEPAPMSQPVDEEPVTEPLDIRHEIMKLSIDDLDASTDDLMQYIMSADFDSPVSRGRLSIKRKALDSVRESYADATTSPFIDWTRIKDIVWKQEEEAETAATVMVRANIATALYETTMLHTKAHHDYFTLIDRLNSFLNLFTYPEDLVYHPGVPELVLEIRTWYLIGQLERHPEKSPLSGRIASVFCEPSDKDVFERLSAGPFKSLGELSNERLEELCAARITQITIIINQHKGNDKVTELKREFPLDDLLEEIGGWLLEMYKAVSGREGNSQIQSQPGSARYTGDDFDDSQTTASESQPIVRPGTGEEIRQSLFAGRESVNYLNNRSRANNSVPPSNQQQMMPPPGAPRDYHQHTNSELLDSPKPISSVPIQPEPQLRAPEPKGKRIRDPFVAEEDDESEDDPFETDSRPVAPGRRAALETSMGPPPKRARLPIVSEPAAPPAARPRTTPSSSEMIQSSNPTREDFETLRQAKELVSSQARATLSPFVRQRHGWSHNDMLLLLNLIRDRHAGWANIESLDNDKFERPRNQQAYRDKARNMKVDYLITDAVLPPCFDLVALGKKEVDRLVSLGKNPYRKEDDVNAEGRATNTEYKPDQHGPLVSQG